MNILDLMQLGATTSLRIAVAIAVLLVLGYLVWPTQSFNFLHGQALDSAAGSANLVAASWGIHCTVTQDGLLSPATLDCAALR
jgi:hypothetical protein